ncbi:hypothetical protein [Bradyrhizobium liaoningense]|uniref:hypothetical protein n=1 Tax=Bradyrhizobium liaoningense TaxID=43992 RepID=UPI001BAA07D6|nr:hypothetical protein [Bradyrhizobium liaoningense]MBR1167473.1 hypothetical protein [Bradyrhizobium liaoningense]
MDLQRLLEQKLNDLPPGPHQNGLKAVMAHIEAALRHLKRGQSEADGSLFTDVVFRCNQAFEGSIKEAYRVLAKKDPQQTTPFQIEQFMASANLLRKKVLDQFTRYRTEWRNPSTHDYTLDFDEDEALLAIVTVTVFAIVLCDQIEVALAFDAAAASTPTIGISKAEEEKPLLDIVTSKVLTFATSFADEATPNSVGSVRQAYYRLEGALGGYLSAELAGVPEMIVKQGRTFEGKETDILVERQRKPNPTENLVVELKVTGTAGILRSGRTQLNAALERTAFFLNSPDVVGGIVFIYSFAEKDYVVTDAGGPLSGRVRIVSPQALQKHLDLHRPQPGERS